MQHRRDEKRPAQGRPHPVPLAVFLGPLGTGEVEAHHHAEHGVARNGKDRPDHGRAEAGVQHIQHVLHPGKAQGDEHAVDDAVEAVVEIRVVPRSFP